MALIFGKAVPLVVAIICSALFVLVACDEIKLVKNEEDIQRDTRDRNGVWFGPRLGKRSMDLSPDIDRQAIFRMLEAADALKYYYDQLQYYDGQADQPDQTKVTKKVIFTPKLGRGLDDEKQFDVDFTPRLGRRRLAEDAVTLSDSDSYRNGQDRIESRSQYFSPRLGRGGSMTFSPRLGRNLIYDLYPSNIRVTRSLNKTKST